MLLHAKHPLNLLDASTFILVALHCLSTYLTTSSALVPPTISLIDPVEMPASVFWNRCRSQGADHLLSKSSTETPGWLTMT